MESFYVDLILLIDFLSPSSLLTKKINPTADNKPLRNQIAIFRRVQQNEGKRVYLLIIFGSPASPNNQIGYQRNKARIM